MLIVVGGRPGVGKTSLVPHLMRPLEAAYVCVETVDLGLAGSSLAVDPTEDAGYTVAFGIARDNLRYGRTVIADCVNGTEEVRSAWRTVAAQCEHPIVEIEVLCSDAAERERRGAARASEGAYPAGWIQRMNERYEEWVTPRFRIDTAGRDPESCAAEIVASIWTGNYSR